MSEREKTPQKKFHKEVSQAFRLVYSLVMIPRLFLSLLFFPLVLSLLALYLQLLISAVAITALNRDSKDIEKTIKEAEDENFVREIIFGNSKRLAPATVCRWIFEESVGADGKIERFEYPPTPECEPNRLDVALRVKDPATYDVTRYKAMFDGNTERLHLCSTCKPDIIIDVTREEVHSHVHSVWGLAILSMAMFTPEVKDHYLDVIKENEGNKGLIGKRFLHSEGFRFPISITGFETCVMLVLNIAFLIIVALWLALKAHRKVLDYFVRNGALLPMVAACGKTCFYSAIWLLTLGRVCVFLLAAVPLSLLMFSEIVDDEIFKLFIGDDYVAFSIWIISLIASMSLATLVASIAELKQRHSMMSFFYKYIPISLCVIGMTVWSFTFLLEGPVPSGIRVALSSIPIVGIGPVLIAPIFRPPFEVLVVHTLLTTVFFLYTARYNTRWFAAHLEDL
jgi:hypothetical protein